MPSMAATVKGRRPSVASLLTASSDASSRNSRFSEFSAASRQAFRITAHGKNRRKDPQAMPLMEAMVKKAGARFAASGLISCAQVFIR